MGQPAGQMCGIVQARSSCSAVAAGTWQCTGRCTSADCPLPTHTHSSRCHPAAPPAPQVRGQGAGLASAAIIAVVPSYISRSVAGSYDLEAVAIFALVFVFYLYVKVSAGVHR